MIPKTLILTGIIGGFLASTQAKAAAPDPVEKVLSLVNGWKKAHPSVAMKTDVKSDKFEAEELHLVTPTQWKTILVCKRPMPFTQISFLSDTNLLIYFPD